MPWANIAEFKRLLSTESKFAFLYAKALMKKTLVTSSFRDEHDNPYPLPVELFITILRSTVITPEEALKLLALLLRKTEQVGLAIADKGFWTSEGVFLDPFRILICIESSSLNHYLSLLTEETRLCWQRYLPYLLQTVIDYINQREISRFLSSSSIIVAINHSATMVFKSLLALDNTDLTRYRVGRRNILHLAMAYLADESALRILFERLIANRQWIDFFRKKYLVYSEDKQTIIHILTPLNTLTCSLYHLPDEIITMKLRLLHSYGLLTEADCIKPMFVSTTIPSPITITEYFELPLEKKKELIGNGINFFHSCCRAGVLNTLKFLLLESGFDKKTLLTTTSADSFSPLWYAVSARKKEVVIFLLSFPEIILTEADLEFASTMTCSEIPELARISEEIVSLLTIQLAAKVVSAVFKRIASLTGSTSISSAAGEAPGSSTSFSSPPAGEISHGAREEEALRQAPPLVRDQEIPADHPGEVISLPPILARLRPTSLAAAVPPAAASEGPAAIIAAAREELVAGRVDPAIQAA